MVENTKAPKKNITISNIQYTNEAR